MFRRSVVLPAAAVMLASAGVVYLAHTSNAQVNAGLDLSAANRRRAVPGLYD